MKASAALWFAASLNAAVGFFVMPLPRTLLHAVILNAIKGPPFKNATEVDRLLTDFEDDGNTRTYFAAEFPGGFDHWPCDYSEDNSTDLDDIGQQSPTFNGRAWDFEEERYVCYEAPGPVASQPGSFKDWPWDFDETRDGFRLPEPNVSRPGSFDFWPWDFDETRY
jgi:hypothetical protein